MEELQKIVDALLKRSSSANEILAQSQLLGSIYPFNSYEYIFIRLLAEGVLSLDEYLVIRADYHSNAKNIDNSKLFNFSPRHFGGWTEDHIKQLIPNVQKANNSSYDFLLHDAIQIEVKSSRAVEYKVNAPMLEKALRFSSGKRFDMNFQQLKPKYCQVFIWVAVWLDVIQYWVLPSVDVENNRFYSDKQHRGNQGEGQLHLNERNIKEFDKYLVVPENLEKQIIEAYEVNQHSRQVE